MIARVASGDQSDPRYAAGDARRGPVTGRAGRGDTIGPAERESLDFGIGARGRPDVTGSASWPNGSVLSSSLGGKSASRTHRENDVPGSMPRTPPIAVPASLNSMSAGQRWTTRLHAVVHQPGQPGVAVAVRSGRRSTSWVPETRMWPVGLVGVGPWRHRSSTHFAAGISEGERPSSSRC